ncbi:MAG: ParB/RepB/Spo0J family partition protein [Gemmataceae bacterium]|nr:ParB/RepB/Spo0J family partition protein [Gemmataceae bacterium]
MTPTAFLPDLDKLPEELIPKGLFDLDADEEHDGDGEDLDGLRRSLEAHGFINRVVAYRLPGGRVKPAAGNRRVAAALLSDAITHVPTRVLPAPPGPKELAKFKLAENVQRKNLSPVQLRGLIAPVLDGEGWTLADLHARLGIHPSVACRAMKTKNLVPEALAYFGPGLCPPSSQADVAGLPPDQQAAFAKLAAEQKWTAARITKEARKRGKKSKGGRPMKRLKLALQVDPADGFEGVEKAAEKLLAAARQVRKAGQPLSMIQQFLR